MENNVKKNMCFCCKKEKEGTFVFAAMDGYSMKIFICHKCNHLRGKNEGKKNEL